MMEKLPYEIINKIFMFMSSPTSIIMKPHIKAYAKYCELIPPSLGRMDFDEFMKVNAMYLDHTSKRHIRESRAILKMFP
jgi:hypothetical protein